MSEIQIEHNIPIPERPGRSGQWKNLVKKMKKGDSVVIPIENQNSFAAAARALGHGVATRPVTDNGKVVESHVRCWLIEKQRSRK